VSEWVVRLSSFLSDEHILIYIILIDSIPELREDANLPLTGSASHIKTDDLNEGASSHEAEQPRDGGEPVPAAAAPHSSQVKATDHPSLAAFFKMQRIGVPESAIRTKMAREGIDPSILDDPEAMLDVALIEENSAGDKSASSSGDDDFSD
jgi:hypothetical protein